MALERWDPFADVVSLRDAMDRLLQSSFVRPGGGLIGTAGGTLPLDVAETENEFIVTASLPGVKPEEVEMAVQGNTLTLRGETKAEEERSGARWHVRERRFGSFARSITLPTAVNADACEARYENGVLTVTLPKAEAAKPKRISIGGASQAQLGQGTQAEQRGS